METAPNIRKQSAEAEVSDEAVSNVKRIKALSRTQEEVLKAAEVVVPAGTVPVPVDRTSWFVWRR